MKNINEQVINFVGIIFVSFGLYLVAGSAQDSEMAIGGGIVTGFGFLVITANIIRLLGSTR